MNECESLISTDNDSSLDGSALPELRIVLLGKTGAGKSSAANTILGGESFVMDDSADSVTRTCERGEAEIDGRKVSVIDSPGLFDTSMSKEKMRNEIEKCIYMSVPGPHVFLLVIRLGVRFTSEEKNTVKWIQENFGEKAVCYTIILFTHTDTLKRPLDVHITMSNDLNALVKEYDGRYHSFNNKDMINNRSQVTELMKKIEKMVDENGGQHYTNEMYQEAQSSILNTTQFWSGEPRIVLLGKAGSGKSSAVQTIVGTKSSERRNPAAAATTTCEIHEACVGSRMMKIIDTPGLIDSPEEKIRAVIDEFVWMSVPGPHVFLLVIRLNVRLTDEEKNTVKWIKRNFGEEAGRYTIILFTYDDHLEGERVDGYIRESNDLQMIVDGFGGRFHSFNNTDTENRSQVTELMEKIEKTAEKNGWKYYTNQMFEDIIKQKLFLEKVKATAVAVGGTAAVAAGAGLLVAEIAVVAPALLVTGGIVAVGKVVFDVAKKYFLND